MGKKRQEERPLLMGGAMKYLELSTERRPYQKRKLFSSDWNKTCLVVSIRSWGYTVLSILQRDWLHMLTEVRRGPRCEIQVSVTDQRRCWVQGRLEAMTTCVLWRNRTPGVGTCEAIFPSPSSNWFLKTRFKLESNILSYTIVMNI